VGEVKVFEAFVDRGTLCCTF